VKIIDLIYLGIIISQPLNNTNHLGGVKYLIDLEAR